MFMFTLWKEAPLFSCWNFTKQTGPDRAGLQDLL